MEVGVKKWLQESQPLLSMLMVQVIASGLQLLSRIILTEGTFIFALMAYRHVVAAVCVFPFAFFLERGNLKKLSWVVLLWIFINALTGITMAMGLFYYGLRDTTATYATNFLNLIPIVTFIFSVLARIEKLGLGTKAGRVKTGGAILCLVGALTISLYKGKAFYIGQPLFHKHITFTTFKAHWTRGTFMLVCSCLSYATWFIVQVKLLKLFPSKYWVTLLTCIIASMQATTIGLCLDRRKAAWRLGWNLQLVTIVYSGALATAASFCLISWVVADRGPTYPSMFNPLALIVVAFSEAFLLGQNLTVGSLLGMAMIIVGLFSFLWGRQSETKSLSQPNLAAGEVATAVLESVTATVMATTSPSNSYFSAEEVAEKNRTEALQA